jgi:hypothetical protein
MKRLLLMKVKSCDMFQRECVRLESLNERAVVDED